MLHKQHGKEKVMVLNYPQYHSESTTFWLLPLVDSKDGVYLAMLFTLRESRRTSDPVLSRVCGPASPRDIGTLDALALKPSGFCNVRVNPEAKKR